MGGIHIWPETPRGEEGRRIVSVTVEGYGERQRLWCAVGEEHAEFLGDGCDGWAIAMVFPAMARGAELVVHGAVSPSLLANLEEFQECWSGWRPELYRRVGIRAEGAWEGARGEGGITAFSGGVDSCATVRRHGEVKTALMVHGFDIPLGEDFRGAAERSRRILGSRGVELVEMATNFREVVRLDWEDVFGAAVGACLTLIGGRFAVGWVPSSDSYRTLILPYGSNPVSDGLLGSERFAIRYDQLRGRPEKVGLLADWPESLQELRVCWEGRERDRNCGKCEKCVRTILSFRVAGMGLPGCFEAGVTEEEIRGLRMRSKGNLVVMQEVLEAAEARGMREAWVRALRDCVAANERRLWWRGVGRRLL